MQFVIHLSSGLSLSSYRCLPSNSLRNESIDLSKDNAIKESIINSLLAIKAMQKSRKNIVFIEIKTGF